MRRVSEMAESPLQGKNWNKLGEVRRGNTEYRNTTLQRPKTLSLAHSSDAETEEVWNLPFLNCVSHT